MDPAEHMLFDIVVLCLKYSIPTFNINLTFKSEHILGPEEKNIDASNGALLKNAYHISHCGGCHHNWCLYLKKGSMKLA